MPIPSLFILGCGRSGTSMTAGLFRNSGRFQGSRLHQATSENTKGYFEDAKINKLNNSILAQYTPKRKNYSGIDYQCDAPEQSGGWLSRIPLNEQIIATTSQQKEIERWIKKEPFCYKDTRFCYLIDLWYKSSSNTRMICVYRRPDIVVESILNNCRVHKHLHKFAISVDQAFQVWILMYKHILNKHIKKGKWLFLEYEDILSGQAYNALELFSETAIDRDFPENRLNRSSSTLEIPKEAKKIYTKLKALSDP